MTINQTYLQGGRFALLGIFINISLCLYPQELSAKTLNIALFDTGFCLEKTQKLLKKLKGQKKLSKVQVMSPVDITNSPLTPKENKAACLNFNYKNRKFHGQWVLEVFLHNLKLNKLKLIIHPYIIFDNNSTQKISYWQRAIKRIKKQKIDYLLLASGILLKKVQIESLPTLRVPTFMAAPKIGLGIKNSSHIWPQITANIASPHFLIGSFHPNTAKDTPFLDRGILYQDKIDYYFNEKSVYRPLTGTSQAVAKAMARAINLCPKHFIKSKNSLRKCLSNHKQKFYFFGQKSAKAAYTY